MYSIPVLPVSYAAALAESCGRTISHLACKAMLRPSVLVYLQIQAYHLSSHWPSLISGRISHSDGCVIRLLSLVYRFLCSLTSLNAMNLGLQYKAYPECYRNLRQVRSHSFVTNELKMWPFSTRERHKMAIVKKCRKAHLMILHT